MKKPETFYYTDPLRDDFARTRQLKPRPLGPDYPYIRKNIFWRALSGALYWGLVLPVAWVYCTLAFHLRIRGRENLRGLRGGFFLYGNHTQHAGDAFLPVLLGCPRRTYIVTGPQAVSIPGLRWLLQLLGALPLPDHLREMDRFREALEVRTAQGAAVCIYPEAHIWPYYTGIRPFSSGSFSYPADLQVPAVPYVVTYRRRKLLKNRPPYITVYVGEPLLPRAQAPRRQERQRLRDGAYGFMCARAREADQPEYYHYEEKSR